MTLAQSARLDWEGGFWGMMRWGAPSSVILILAPMLLGLTPNPSNFWLTLIFGLPLGTIFAVTVWGIGGLLVALPLWSILLVTGVHRLWLRRAMIGLGAVVVAGLWGWCAHEILDLPAFFFAFAAAGAISGALGGYGFCRSAIRS